MSLHTYCENKDHLCVKPTLGYLSSGSKMAASEKRTALTTEKVQHVNTVAYYMIHLTDWNYTVWFLFFYIFMIFVTCNVSSTIYITQQLTNQWIWAHKRIFAIFYTTAMDLKKATTVWQKCRLSALIRGVSQEYGINCLGITTIFRQSPPIMEAQI